uniref:Uncharacterized protein n=1 Tax=Anopheles albimanus TaxID=7167 RepID=A0A182FHP9_ANOAL
MDPAPPALTTGSVFPVRPSLDAHLLAMGDDIEEDLEQRPFIGADSHDPVITAPLVGTDAGEIDEEEPSEITEPQEQPPDVQQSAGSSGQDHRGDIKNKQLLVMPPLKTLVGDLFVLT